MFRNWMVVIVATACVVLSACGKTAADDAGAQAAAKPERRPEVQAAIDQQAAAAVVPADLSAAGVTVSEGAVRKVGDELEVTGTLANTSGKAVDGVNLMITFQTETGLTLGGHNTQQYFQPALASGKNQPLVLRAPAIGGTVDTAKKVKIQVVNLVKSGQSPDGWKPLDPNNLPEPKVVGESKSVTLPVAPVDSAQTAPPASADDTQG